MANKVVNMIVLGPSRVGKTSLLATMYKEFARLKTGFDFKAIGEARDQMNDAYLKLNEVMNCDRYSVVGGLIPGNQTFAEYRFDVSFHGVKEFEIAFHDYRGGTLMKTTDPEFPELQARISASHVIFNVLDAVALMEVNAVKSEELNAHDRVREVFLETLKPNEKYLIVFVLVKCETYVKTARAREQLVNRFEERHCSVLRLIERLNEANKNVAALLIPAITLGCVEFKEIDEKGDFIFERNHKDFEPREVDQPLRYALSFALDHVNENRRWWAKIWRAVTGHGKAFGQALKDFYGHRSGNYKKYGNEALLR